MVTMWQALFQAYSELTAFETRLLPIFLFPLIVAFIPYVLAVLFMQAIKGSKRPDWLACLTLAAYGYLLGVATAPLSFDYYSRMMMWIEHYSGWSFWFAAYVPALLLIFLVITIRARFIKGWGWRDAMRLAVSMMVAAIVAWSLFFWIYSIVERQYRT
jgi:hypothetical protein